MNNKNIIIKRIKIKRTIRIKRIINTYIFDNK
jgi:hypothetical protein